MKLQLGEILHLEKEINGYVNPETNEQEFKGFINQDLSIILKYKLSELSDFLTNEKKKVGDLRDSLIKKYGKPDEEGKIVVKMFIEDESTSIEGEEPKMIVNPEFKKLDEEFGKLLVQEIEVDVPEITLDDLKEAGKTKDNYKLLFKLIKKGTN